MTVLLKDWQIFLCLFHIFLQLGDGWRAVPANQANYAARSYSDDDDPSQGRDKSDELLPRNTLNNIYKFGYCTRDIVNHRYLKKSVNISFVDWKSTHVTYIYLLAKKHTQKFRHQCIVMKMYVPAKYLFYKSRLPLYYCQGTVHYLMMNTINRYEIHEFYLARSLLVPANFVFEFYHYNRF